MDRSISWAADPRAPRHWIGIEREWRLASKSPFHHLVSLPPENLKTHALLLGATGSGKTNLLHHLIAQDVLLNHSFVVLDLRGDLVSAALEILAGRIDPERVGLIDLREKAVPQGFNPLGGPGEPYFRALGVLDAVESESESWGVQLGETLRNGLMLLSEVGEPLTRLEDLFYDARFLSKCIDHTSGEGTARFWGRFLDLSLEKKSALALPVLNKVSMLLSTKTLRDVLGHREPLDLGALLSTPGNVLLISLAVDELHAAGRMMGRIILASVCREIFARVSLAESRRNPVRLYVDEFEHFGTAEFESILAEGRRFKLSLVLAHQTLSQLTPAMRSLILGNVGSKVIFRCGREDSAVLSRDLTGDPKAIDFTSQTVGEAVLWRREEGVLAIEVNSPIVRDVGTRSARAEWFRGEVLKAGEPWECEPPEAPSGFKSGPDRSAPAPSDSAQGKAAAHPPQPTMEDWLCG